MVFFIKKIVKNSKIFIISLLKKTKILKVMSYEVRIHAPSDLSEKWYVYIYSEGKIIKKFYKGLAKESTYTDRMLKAEILKSIIEKEIKTGWKPDAPELPTPENNNYSIKSI